MNLILGARVGFSSETIICAVITIRILFVLVNNTLSAILGNVRGALPHHYLWCPWVEGRKEGGCHSPVLFQHGLRLPMFDCT